MNIGLAQIIFIFMMIMVSCFDKESSFTMKFMTFAAMLFIPWWGGFFSETDPTSSITLHAPQMIWLGLLCVGLFFIIKNARYGIQVLVPVLLECVVIGSLYAGNFFNQPYGN